MAMPSCLCPDTEALFQGERILRFTSFEAVAMPKLAVLNRADVLADVRIPPGNRRRPEGPRNRGRPPGGTLREAPFPSPGAILEPMGIPLHRLAKEIGVPQRRLGEIVTGSQTITADTGLRRSKCFGTSEGFWTGLQLDFDAAKAKDEMAETLASIHPWAS